MQFDWQTIVAILIVALAFVALVWRSIKNTGKMDGCGGGGCHGCSHSKNPSPLVQIKLSPVVERENR